MKKKKRYFQKWMTSIVKAVTMGLNLIKYLNQFIMKTLEHNKSSIIKK